MYRSAFEGLPAYVNLDDQEFAWQGKRGVLDIVHGRSGMTIDPRGDVTHLLLAIVV